ncbi:phBC6A51 family helix-turn-helix protein [Salibacterium halotolerans]|uniref:Helix-turn-helix of insertion element transposase n=1 Tax=Salibacterium halotolerans TaxID=1884432 RepID=A0A1I5UUG7_9BACI|nr:phBC6A51 family helix-turn-helix protein [Salibacterium halotolerans]SFP98954.1 Helix-turn-helix of insertion element transposase [Salibacterium halotolerans]
MSRTNDLARKLSSQQRHAAHLLVDKELTGNGRTIKDIADEVGVSDRMVYHWKKEETFILYKNAINEQQIAEVVGEIDGLLINHIREMGSKNGSFSVKAMELAYKRLGMLTNKSEIEMRTDETAKQAHSNEQIQAEIAELDDMLAETDTESDEGENVH